MTFSGTSILGTLETVEQTALRRRRIASPEPILPASRGNEYSSGTARFIELIQVPRPCLGWLKHLEDRGEVCLLPRPRSLSLSEAIKLKHIP